MYEMGCKHLSGGDRVGVHVCSVKRGRERSRSAFQRLRDESLAIHKKQREWWKRDKRGPGGNNNLACCGKELSIALVLMRARSCRFTQSYPFSWAITAQFTPSQTCAHTATPLSHPWGGGWVPVHLHLTCTPRALTLFCTCVLADVASRACTRAHAHSWRYMVKIRSDPERRRGTRHARDVRCHNNTETP